jgi:hypothetical protein
MEQQELKPFGFPSTPTLVFRIHQARTQKID